MKKLLPKWSRSAHPKSAPGNSDGPELPEVQKTVWLALFGRWVWKVDGCLAAVVALTMTVDKFVTSGGRLQMILNVFALFALGLILKRNLRRDVKWRDLPDIMRQARSK
ncbi:hypothetical protein [Paraburkholderia sp. SIMBA_054]|uniref:hypothetical protein n=1 Tax=Paraburkholderia sp. SIMBA_054 TaxID=3085795 RepID=UPI003978D71A